MKKLCNKEYLFCLLIASIFLLVGTKSSPLYVINDWVDANCFFTVGKGMMNGLVPYLDLFEQKGPLLYFIHGLAYLISNKTFLGVYIFESIAISIFLYYIYKILKMYLKDKESLLLLPVILTVILISNCFKMGDSAEEFVLPFLAYSLYTFIRHFKQKEELNNIDFIINGICAGCVLWIKYSMIGFWFAWMMCLFIDKVLNKEYSKSIKICFYYLFGMLLSTIPWLIYFATNHALDSFIDVYFKINLSSYSEAMGLVEKLKRCIELFIISAKRNKIIGFLFMLGLFNLLNKDKKRLKIFILILFSFLTLTIYIGGFSYKYYFLILSPFVIFGLIIIIKILNKFVKIDYNKWGNILLLIVTVLSFYTLIIKSNNVKDMGNKKEDYAQYYFLKYINEVDNPTILNYGFLDGGFYLTTNTLPNNKYFIRVNIKYQNYPTMMDSQNESVKNKKTDFVIVRTKYNVNFYELKIPNLNKNYYFVDEFNQIRENKRTKYMLFRKK